MYTTVHYKIYISNTDVDHKYTDTTTYSTQVCTDKYIGSIPVCIPDDIQDDIDDIQ